MVDPRTEAVIDGKVKALISRKGVELESRFRDKDIERSGLISVKAFSECLRAVADTGASHDDEEGTDEAGPGNRLTRLDRKVLYKRWAVHREVRA